MQGSDGDGVLMFVDPRDGATTHSGNVASAGTTVDAVAKGEVMREKQITRDRADESKAVSSLWYQTRRIF